MGRYYHPMVELDSSLSDETKELVISMLQEDPSRRPSKKIIDAYFGINRFSIKNGKKK